MRDCSDGETRCSPFFGLGSAGTVYRSVIRDLFELCESFVDSTSKREEAWDVSPATPGKTASRKGIPQRQVPVHARASTPLRVSRPSLLRGGSVGLRKGPSGGFYPVAAAMKRQGKIVMGWSAKGDHAGQHPLNLMWWRRYDPACIITIIVFPIASSEAPATGKTPAQRYNQKTPVATVCHCRERCENAMIGGAALLKLFRWLQQRHKEQVDQGGSPCPTLFANRPPASSVGGADFTKCSIPTVAPAADRPTASAGCLDQFRPATSTIPKPEEIP